MKIVIAPNKILSTKTKTVKEVNKKVKQIIKDIVQTLESQSNPIGVGLAANQVGLDLSIFIIKPTEKSPIEIFINPTILETKNEKRKTKKDDSSLEGCLSIPHIWGEVKRADSVLLKYQNMEGKWITKWFTGFKAIIIQHEADHLNGILFTQRIIEQDGTLYEEKGKKLIQKYL